MPDRDETPPSAEPPAPGLGASRSSLPSRCATSSSTRPENSNRSSDRPPSVSCRLMASMASSPSAASPPYALSAFATSATVREPDPSTSTAAKARRIASGTRWLAASSSAADRCGLAPAASTHRPESSADPEATRQPSPACKSRNDAPGGTGSCAAQCGWAVADVPALDEIIATVRADRCRTRGSSTRQGAPSSTSNSAVAAA
mmetsp:Transcript_27865/g.88702  ORF Transcript_27865/g.88702 Transcript_27865/m.88702 type:complete len:203 (+) Transcript_27865:670-1278(+)